MPLLPASGATGLFGDYRRFAGWKFPLALGLMLAGAVAEGIGIFALVPLIVAANGSGELPKLFSVLPDFAHSNPDRRLSLALALFGSAMIARGGLLYARDLLLAWLTAEYEASMMLRAASRLAGMGWAKSARVGQAGMQALLLTDIPRCAAGVQQGQQALVALILLFVQVGLAMLLSPTLALIALLIIVGGIAVSWPWFGKAKRSGVAIAEINQRSTESAFRLHAGLKSALAQGTVSAFLGEYRTSLGHLAAELVRFARDQAIFRALSSVAVAAAAVLLLLLGMQWLGLPFAVLLTLLILFARMSGPAQQLQQALQNFFAYAQSFTAIERKIGTLDVAAPESRDVQPLDWRELNLDHVGYDHGEGGIENLSLSLESGEWLGIAGASGAGKTTLIDVVAGLIEPKPGTVLVDGERLDGKRLDRWRRSLAYVGQGDMLFDDSVRGNLLASADASDDELWQTLETVGLAARLRLNADGLDAELGDRGSSLSGGERQRLALARALIRKPSLLILDEASNALDEESEEQLLSRLRALQPRPAALIVAHRSRTLSLCDRVLRVGQGAQGDQ
jgi:ATP-binding cassette subfamily C protein